MSEKIYLLTLEADSKMIGFANGDVEEIAYTFKRALVEVEDGDTVEAYLAEVDARGVERTVVKELASLTADAETVGLVLRRRITAARKAAREGRPVAGEPSEPTPITLGQNEHTQY